MVALYSVNLRIMGAPNLSLLGEPSVFAPFVNDSNGFWMRCVVIGGFVLVAKLLLDWFFSTETGLAMRATGSNLKMSQAQGINTDCMTMLGMAISNGLIALAGALFVQTQGGADISIGIGTIVIGLAAVIIGETIIPAKRMLWITLSVIVGAVLYKSFIQIALASETLRQIGFESTRFEYCHRAVGHYRADFTQTQKSLYAKTPRALSHYFLSSFVCIAKGALGVVGNLRKTAAMMQAQDLRLTFNPGTPIENPALRGLSLEIGEGEFVTVIGTNGAGKSTFLNAVAGTVRVDNGQILLNGIDVTRQSAYQRAGLVARVFQDPMAGTCEHLTIEENMALAYKRGGWRGLSGALSGKNRELFREKLAILKLGLENRLTDRMGLLSGGQRQAVSLLMASLQPSKILLLDEHTAALDPKTADFVLQLTDQIVHDNGLTAMMVTHSMQQALNHGSRTVMLHQGQVVLDVSGEQRRGMTVQDLLAMFERTRGEVVADDSLLLS